MRLRQFYKLTRTIFIRFIDENKNKKFYTNLFKYFVLTTYKKELGLWEK